jgi:hypothetical protein
VIATAVSLASCGLMAPSFAADSSVCPAPFAAVQRTCQSITHRDLPQEALSLLLVSQCDVAPGSNYDYGVSIALGIDGQPAYQFCCHAAPHGPCDSILIGTNKGKWQVLGQHILGFDADPPCGELLVLEQQSEGLHDICIPTTVPPILRFSAGSYKAFLPSSVPPRKSE